MKILASKNEIATNRQLRDILYEYLKLGYDPYYGDVSKAMDSIVYDYDGIWYFDTDRYGDIVNVTGEFHNGEPIDLRVILCDDGKVVKVEDF